MAPRDQMWLCFGDDFIGFQVGNVAERQAKRSWDTVTELGKQIAENSETLVGRSERLKTETEYLNTSHGRSRRAAETACNATSEEIKDIRNRNYALIQAEEEARRKFNENFGAFSTTFSTTPPTLTIDTSSTDTHRHPPTVYLGALKKRSDCFCFRLRVLIFVACQPGGDIIIEFN